MEIVISIVFLQSEKKKTAQKHSTPRIQMWKVTTAAVVATSGSADNLSRITNVNKSTISDKI